MDSSQAPSLPKAELHLHQEMWPRLERLSAQRTGRDPFDWTAALGCLDAIPPGRGRLDRIYEPDASLNLAGATDDDVDFVTRVAALLEEAASDDALLVEVRFGANQVQNRPAFMTLFRQAEALVRQRRSDFWAEAIGYVVVASDPERRRLEERKLRACAAAADDGLSGVDFITDPYDQEAGDEVWATLDRWAEQAAEAGLGITVHAGEFAVANVVRAARIPHLRRLGHAVYAPRVPGFLEHLAERGVTIECCLTSNVVLGAVPSYEAHPIGSFVAAGVPVALSTDLPVHLATTIGHEYDLAASLGFTQRDLLGFTENAITASFTSEPRRSEALAVVQQWATTDP